MWGTAEISGHRKGALKGSQCISFLHSPAMRWTFFHAHCHVTLLHRNNSSESGPPWTDTRVLWAKINLVSLLVVYLKYFSQLWKINIIDTNIFPRETSNFCNDSVFFTIAKVKCLHMLGHIYHSTWKSFFWTFLSKIHCKVKTTKIYIHIYTCKHIYTHRYIWLIRYNKKTVYILKYYS